MEMTLHRSGATSRRSTNVARSEGLLAGALVLVLWAAGCMPSALFTFLVAAAVLEEIVFRAGLQTQLMRRFSMRSANVLTALAFAVAHLLVRPSLLSALTFFPAMAIGFLFERQRRVLPCIALHTAFNATWLALFGFTA
jgi:membrane protease YdiL (CAAX protease family)